MTYDYLVVNPGLVNNLDGIEGLREGIESGVVCSNYVDSRKTWELLQKFNGGNAVFTQPTTPIKCGGAPQKQPIYQRIISRKEEFQIKPMLFLQRQVL